MEEEQEWIFTWGYRHKYPNKYTIIKGTRASAREEMFRRHGAKWAFQYSISELESLHNHNIVEVTETNGR